jgi:TPR repeat protein
MDSEDHNLDAQFHLALCRYARQSYTESLNLFQKIADRGSKEAQYMLATQYEEGKGTDCNDTIAFRLYLKAHEQGHLGAMVKYENLMEQ